MRPWNIETAANATQTLIASASALAFLSCVGISGAEPQTAKPQNAVSMSLEGEQPSAMEIADAYLEVYVDFNLEKMEPFYSEDAVFIDPTSEVWGEDGFDWHGKKEVMAGMEAVVAEFNPKVEYFIKEKYESAGHVVYTGKAKAITTVEGVIETACVAVTTIITVKAGKIAEHRDYVDYTTYENTDWTGNQECAN